MKFFIGSTLAELRKAKRFMQKDVAAKLTAYGINISAKTVHNWEKGNAMPSVRQFLALCDILGVDDVLYRFTGAQKGVLAGLNTAGRKKARELIDLLLQVSTYKNEAGEELTDSPRLLRLYDIPVSAGSGNFLDDSGYDMIKVPAYVPIYADFALRVSGDSMEPMIQDGQIIWVKEQETLNTGEIGIFTYSGDVYCKELVTSSDKTYLRSLNTLYDDVEILEDFGFKIIGKVVS